MFNKTILLTIVIFGIVYCSAQANDLGYEPGELILRFAPKASGKQRTPAERSALLTSIGAGTVKHSSKFDPGLTRVKLPENISVENAIGLFKDTDGILSAQPNYIYKALSTVFPNDPYGPDPNDGGGQWGLHNTGQTGGTDDADIDAPEAWSTITDVNTMIDPNGVNKDIIIAVIDSGIDSNHPDLAANLWTNEGEIPDNCK